LPDSDAARAALARGLAEAVSEAGALARSMCGAALKSWTKGKGSPVTEADIAVDNLLRARLAKLVPDAAWLSEETTDDSARLAASRLWIVDPIDGTRAYMAGFSDWSVCAAFVEDGRPTIAAIHAPAEDALFLATAGGGASRNGAPISASDGSRLEALRAAGPQSQFERFTSRGLQLERLPRIHSMALRLVRVAEGALDVAFAGGSSHDWDVAAADLLVREAGGVLTTFDGQQLVYNRAKPVHDALIAAGRERHAKLLELRRLVQPGGVKVSS